METNNQLVTRSTFSNVEKAMQDAGFSVERVKQEISFAIQNINKSAQLQKCSKESILQAVLNVSNIGLSLNPAAKESYLIPRWNGLNNCMEASFEPGYIGLVKLLTDAGSVTSMLCQLVHENDTFQIDLANNVNPVVHRPELNKEKRGKTIGCYALATLPDKTRQVEYMTIEEIFEIRERSETYKAWRDKKIKSCTWVTDEGEMSRKTVIKRIYKYLPRTERMQQIDNAVQIDNADFSASEEQIRYVESLLESSTLDQRQRDAIEMELSVMTAQRAGEVITMLKNNQLGIDGIINPNQKDISNHLKRFTKIPA